MAKNPSFIQPFHAEVLETKGDCSAGHRKGDTLTLSCYDSGGLCGFFYHDIFPSLNVLQFGGKFPWADQNELILECPDRQNTVVLKIAKV